MESPGGISHSLNGESSSSIKDYEVFLNFRGPDTRLTITDSLYETMIRAGIHVFKDDEELRVGEEIGGELERAISNSKIYIPIFSKDYASSKWCLRELALMVEHRKRDKKVILPIFYEVDASDLKLKTGSYGQALRKHERQSGENVAKQWEGALREVAGIKGWNLKDHGQDKLIALVLEEVFEKLRSTQRNWRDGLVGIHDRMEAVMKLLGLGTSGVRFVVIHGMGGIGKTTLAKAIFKHISSQFHCSSFLLDIRADNILSLQKKLLCDTHFPKITIIDADVGMEVIKRAFRHKKVILVLDDMDKRDQLMKLAGESSWFGSGSRIIITTRNTYFFATETDTLDDNIVPLGHRDFFFYEMKEMQFDYALQLFSKHSFERDSPPHDYISISSEIVRITGGLPLALEVIGSLLHSQSKRMWKDTLEKLKKVPDQHVQKKLLISYEELEYEQRQIFLDIACHCIGEERIPAYYMWKACEYFPKTGLCILIHLSLIKIIEDDRLWMHDQLRDLGREIVRKECIEVPGKRSRLWCPKVALDVVQYNRGTENIVALKLTRLANAHNFLSGEISRLPSLRFLELDGGNFVGDFKNLLLNLTWLSWHHCPSNLHATGLCLRNLAVLKLSETDITEDWNGWGPCTVSDNLKVIYLTRCHCLTTTPDFSKCVNLKRLVLDDCCRLEEIHGSIDQLGRLKYLEIRKEKRITLRYHSSNAFDDVNDFSIPLIPTSIGGLKSLSMLKVENQDHFSELPHSIGELLGLKHLTLRNCTKLRKLPDSIGELKSLLYLDLSRTRICGLPDSIGRLESLLKMDLSLTLIAELPNSIGNLRRLKFMCLGGTSISELPKNIWTLESLEELIARGCPRLKGEIPMEIAGLSQLTILHLSRTGISSLPMTINRLSNLRELVLSDCDRLQTLPDLPTSLTKLELSSSSLQADADLSNLINLLHLDISNCAYDFQSFKTKQGQIPHPNLEGLGRLHKLQMLRLVLSDSNLPPTDLSSLSQLRSLELTCPDPQSLIRLPSSLEVLSLEDVRRPIEWPLFSNLGNLSELKLSGCQLRELEFDNVLGQLEKLHCLQVRKSESLVRLSNLSSLKELQVLSVEYCPQLTVIESQPSSTGDCSSTERPIPDSRKLEKLQSFRVYYCASVRKLPAIPNACDVEVYPWKFLKRSG
ncbi:disease resistance protein L6-like [Syzygium oleosum]|uniref:disease resistance protein L6-like n=1 Tax=Syzygium oleosum TaxID=219896 RepID=UPI0024B8DE5F|nr:disease resistance protein L6-like [Syzygium oleosum]